MKKVILYVPGSHGSFLKFLFDCYDAGRVLEIDTGITGNWHATRSKVTNNVCFDMANADQIVSHAEINYEHEKYNVVFDTLDDFCYILQCFIDRGGDLCWHSGIELLENDLEQYEKEYKVKTTYRQTIKDLYNHNGKVVPRFVLRNLFIMIFITHFNHVCWKLNTRLKKNNNIIRLPEILDYKKLKSRLDKVFGKSLDFSKAHAHMLDNNKPYVQMGKIREIIEAVEKDVDIPIEGLNTISEAYLCFHFERQHYSINFNLSNSFFENTKDLRAFINHYPSYMRRPNNLFLTHWRTYNRDE